MVTSLVASTIKQLVERPELIQISEAMRDDKPILEIKVSSQDLGRIIGREGQTIKALRELVRAVDPSYDKEIVVSALD